MRATFLGTLLCGVVVLAVGACSADNATTTTTTPTTDAGTDSGATTGDGGSDAGTTALTSFCTSGVILDFAPGQEQALLDAVNNVPAQCTTIRLASGTFKMPNAITIRQAGITVSGAGKGAQGQMIGSTTSTVLDFTSAVANANGVDHVGDYFTIKNVAIIGAPNDALRVESSTNVRIQAVRAEWAVENLTTNGKYGLYPVKSTNVLIEDSEAYNAADAGIYVGQTTNSIIRNNIAKKNVAGIEVENCLHAEASGNTAEDNTTGLVVFDLPGNPVAGTDIKLFNNTVTGNNRANFGASTVGAVPSGTGTFVMASRRVEITGNTYGNNATTDVAVINGLSLQSDPSAWMPANNFQTNDVWVHANIMQGTSGTNVDNGNIDPVNRPLGYVLKQLYPTAGNSGVESFLWDGIGTNPLLDDSLVNDINLCIDGNTFSVLLGIVPVTTKQIADLDLAYTGALVKGGNSAGARAKVGHVNQGVAPFNCTGFTPALTAVTLPE